VIAFSWAALLDRIPTRTNLALCQVLGSQVPNSCVLSEWGWNNFPFIPPLSGSCCGVA